MTGSLNRCNELRLGKVCKSPVINARGVSWSEKTILINIALCYWGQDSSAVALTRFRFTDPDKVG